MNKPTVTLADWRAQVDKELAGVAFDKALVHTTGDGLTLQPLYVEAPADPGLPGAAPFVRGADAADTRFAICMRVDAAAGRRPEALAEDLGGGADALWFDSDDTAALDAVLAAGRGAVIDVAAGHSARTVLATIVARAAAAGVMPSSLHVALGADPVTAVATGAAPASGLAAGLTELAAVAREALATCPGATPGRVSTLAFHAAGAEPADELALALSTGALYLGAMLEAGLELPAAAGQLTLQVAVGRDTFGELCKLRALRLCWHKLLAAAGAPALAPPRLHAVAATRTQSQRDPWVNMLRVTTEVFAAALGGAALVTPRPFDDALGVVSALGRRVARNTALVLREESHLGRVTDPAGGAYYIEAHTDALARAAWARFTALEREGGIATALASGALRTRLEATWAKRAAALARRKEPVLGVSEFANLGEQLPAPVPPAPDAPAAPALIMHRDGEAFEVLRAQVDAAGGRAVRLVTLGPPAEHRARAGFAAAFFAAGGVRSHEASHDPSAASAAAGADLACLCGSDERYAAEAAEAAAALKAAGWRRVVLAGRPGTLEAELRAAGVDGFIFVGADLVATLADLLGGAS